MVCVRVYTCTRAFCAFGVHFGCGVLWAPWMILGRGFLFCYRFRFGGNVCVVGTCRCFACCRTCWDFLGRAAGKLGTTWRFLSLMCECCAKYCVALVRSQA
jgi:hypothetical protein